MDSWTNRQVLHMRLGGNLKFRRFFKAHQVPLEPWQFKYSTDVVNLYIARLLEEVNNCSIKL